LSKVKELINLYIIDEKDLQMIIFGERLAKIIIEDLVNMSELRGFTKWFNIGLMLIMDVIFIFISLLALLAFIMDFAIEFFIMGILGLALSVHSLRFTYKAITGKQALYPSMFHSD
jgi:hypothetical protein